MNTHPQNPFSHIQIQVKECRQFTCTSVILPKRLYLVPILNVLGITAVIFPSLYRENISETVKTPKKKVSEHKRPHIRKSWRWQHIWREGSTRHDLDMSPSTEESNVVPGKLNLVTWDNTIFEKLDKFLVQWTYGNSRDRRPQSPRLAQERVLDTFGYLEVAAKGEEHDSVKELSFNTNLGDLRIVMWHKL